MYAISVQKLDEFDDFTIFERELIEDFVFEAFAHPRIMHFADCEDDGAVLLNDEVCDG